MKGSTYIIVDHHDNPGCIPSVFGFYCSLLDPGGRLKPCQVSSGINRVGITIIFQTACV